MIRINLLPVRQTRKLEAARLELTLAIAGGLLVTVLSGATWALFTWQLSATQDENAALQAEIDRLAADVAKVDEMEKFKAELERKLAVIQGLRDKKAGPVHMLDEIAVATPEKLFVTSVKEKSGQLQLAGVSVSNDVISQFLRALDDSPYFEGVYLEDIEAMPPEKNLSITLKKFKLTAKLVTPPTAVAAAVPATGAPATAGAAAPEGATPAQPTAAPDAPVEGAAPAPPPGGGA
jgi:type IV pilus assembly protein PilN